MKVSRGTALKLYIKSSIILGLLYIKFIDNTITENTIALIIFCCQPKDINLITIAFYQPNDINRTTNQKIKRLKYT